MLLLRVIIIIINNRGKIQDPIKSDGKVTSIWDNKQSFQNVRPNPVSMADLFIR